MVMKRKAIRRRSPKAKRVRRTGNAVSMSLTRTPVHSFRRNTARFTVAGNAAFLPYQSTTNVALNQLVNSSDFTQLYEQFRITYVVIKFFLRIDPSAQAAAMANFPRLYWCRDTNDATPLTENEMYERADMRSAILKPERPVIMKFKPNVLQTNYLSGVTSAYTAKWGEWIDTVNAGIPYFGCKWNIDNLTNTNYRVDIDQTFYFQCKGAK